MDAFTTILTGITISFFVLLGVKQAVNKKLKKEFCVICLSVSLMWILLFGLYLLNLFSDKTIIALLIGMSITGIFYYLENKTNKDLRVFRLPFILTLILIFYSMLEGFSFYSFYVVLGVWVLFGLIFLFRHNEKFKIIVNKLTECCKKW